MLLARIRLFLELIGLDISILVPVLMLIIVKVGIDPRTSAS